MNVDLSSLAIFRVAAIELSMTRAARRLGRAQSNVTTRIQQLEEDLGVALFVREGRGMALTDEGRRFLVYAERLLALADEARQVLHPAEPAGVLRLGSMESTAASRLPAVLADYHANHALVRLEVSTGPSRALLDGVVNGALDAALVALPPGDDALPDGLQAAPVFVEELVLLLPPSHPRVRRPQQVQGLSLAGFAAGCTYRGIAEDRLPQLGPTQVVGSYHAMIACVAAGACVSVVPRSVLDTVAELPDFGQLSLGRIDTMLAWREGFETPAFLALRAALPARRRRRAG